MTFNLRPLLAVLLLLVIACCDRKSVAFLDGNRLAKSGSPYLQEHADNPVDWYEWGHEALEKAKSENKPLLISIGYAACHWCHVMEEESFMDTAVAKIMNQHFVSIKIDREQRPDIDQIYLDAAQMISGNSGWPLNAFALPDGQPFYAATYFPKAQWIQLLKQVAGAYTGDYQNVVKQAEALTDGIRSNQVALFTTDSLRAGDEQLYNDLFDAWEADLDFQNGGLAGAPKFPMPGVWEFLLQYNYVTGNQRSLDIVTTTLNNILSGGLYDVLAGGFARYSVDEKWMVPHFEKMLYDNGQLVSLFAHAYQVSENPLYAEAIKKTLNFVTAEMTSQDGGFYSSINADSEGEEGKYYVWTKQEIEQVLDERAASFIIDYYNITDSGNWEHGKNILSSTLTREEFSIKKGLQVSIINQILADAEAKLLLARDRRVSPSLDDKILLSWNALMLRGYVDAYLALGKTEFLEQALKNADFLDKNLSRPDGRLWRSYQGGKAAIDAFLEDYALLSRAFITLYQATLDVQWLDKAKSLAKYAIENFRDDESGMFYFTSLNAESLVVRRMETTDNVIPSSNSVMAEVLFLLGNYYSDESFLDISAAMIDKMRRAVETGGPYYANWARFIGVTTQQPYEVAIVGGEALVKSREMQSHYLPTAMFMGGSDENLPLLKNKAVAGRTLIYVCKNKVCKMPVESVASALEQIDRTRLKVPL